MRICSIYYHIFSRISQNWKKVNCWIQNQVNSGSKFSCRKFSQKLTYKRESHQVYWFLQFHIFLINSPSYSPHRIIQLLGSYSLNTQDFKVLQVGHKHAFKIVTSIFLTFPLQHSTLIDGLSVSIFTCYN